VEWYDWNSMLSLQKLVAVIFGASFFSRIEKMEGILPALESVFKNLKNFHKKKN